MEFLQGNWFSILAVLAYAIGRLITWGRRDAKQDQTAAAVEKFEEKFDLAVESMETKIDQAVTKFDEHVEAFNRHVGDPDIHVNRNLRDLFDSRFKLIEEIQRNTRIDVGRLQKTLDDM